MHNLRVLAWLLQKRGFNVWPPCDLKELDVVKMSLLTTCALSAAREAFSIMPQTEFCRTLTALVLRQPETSFELAVKMMITASTIIRFFIRVHHRQMRRCRG